MTGEEKHERCRFGMMTPAFRIDGFMPDYGWAVRPRETPTVMPLCLWKLPADAPPAVSRAWGGAVEFERDCAVCRAYSPL